MFRIVVHGLQIVERRGRIGQFADALVVFALTAPDPTEIEPKHGKAHVVKGVVQVIHDLVVHGAAELRVWMQHDRDGRVFFLLRVVAAFEPAFGAGKDYLGHGFPVSSSWVSAKILTTSLGHLRNVLNCDPGQNGSERDKPCIAQGQSVRVGENR